MVRNVPVGGEDVPRPDCGVGWKEEVLQLGDGDGLLVGLGVVVEGVV